MRYRLSDPTSLTGGRPRYFFKASGAPCDVFREHLILNSGSFSTTANTDSDFWPETARINGMPLRLGHLPDATAYATQPVDSSWEIRVRQGWTPANTKGSGSAGALT